MRCRSVLLVASAAVLLLAPASFAQGQRGNNMRGGAVKSADTGAKTFVVTMRGRGANAQPTDVTIKTTDQTRYMHYGDNGTFADLKEGRYAFFLGEGTPDTGITAREVIVLDKPGAVQTGVVKSVDTAGNSFVITTGRPGGQQREVTIKVGDKTKYMAGREAAKWSDVAAEKRVSIVGEGTAREGLSAVIVRILPAAAGGQ
jgi:hypothetical protein